MAILNYTTTITVEKTSFEITNILRKAGAKSILAQWDDDQMLSAISFEVNTPHGQIYFRVSPQVEGVLKILRRNDKVARKFKTVEHAHKVSWRIEKDWIAAQMAKVDAGLAELPQVFLGYAQAPNGDTFYKNLVNRKFGELTHDKN